MQDRHVVALAVVVADRSVVGGPRSCPGRDRYTVVVMPTVPPGSDERSDAGGHAGLQPGTRVLAGRYELVRQLAGATPSSEHWLGVGAYDARLLIKLWPYAQEEPDDLTRALWDAELRTLYRIASSPGAEHTVVVLRDAGVDRDARCFVMVLQTTGFVTLADALADRASRPWLSNLGPTGRRELWTALGQLADGLRLLHDQQVIHRDVRAETVFFDDHLGLPSVRLGGFEWSVRLGVPVTADPPTSWSTPPEAVGGGVGYRLEVDWYGFGVLAARCLLDLESYGDNPALERHKRTLLAIERATTALTPLERDLLVRLVAADTRDRIAVGSLIKQRIDEVIAALGERAAGGAADRPFVLVINPHSADFIDSATAAGFRPDKDDPLAPFLPLDVGHVAALRQFVRRDLEGGQLHAVGDQPRYILVGDRMSVAIRPWTAIDHATHAEVTTWNAVFATAPANLRAAEGNSASTSLPGGRLSVTTPAGLQRSHPDGFAWDAVLPRVDRAASLRAGLQRFHELVRCMNQIELLLRDAELFAYRVVERPEAEPGFEEVVVEQTIRQRPPVDFALINGGMAEFLQQELESNKPKSQKVILGEAHEDSVSVEWIPEPSQWDIVQIAPDTGRVRLRRAVSAEQQGPAPAIGILRTHGFFGQMSLIKRRKRAIDRLATHSYLLRSLSAPGQVYMETGPNAPLIPLDPNVVDEPKRSAIGDILRVRPIYSLQGPPGTGKTTLVAWLVREILQEDPVAQILVTAQAHGAVDVLREKVRNEAFAHVPEDRQPLAVRLGANRAADSDDLAANIPSRDPSTVEGVALKVLELASTKLDAEAKLTSVQTEWRRAVDEMAGALRTGGLQGGAPDFCELIRRGAHLTYCTTSAGELEELADLTQSFDWSILEEAGKAHSFDLALPLQAGHRWLLIGDQKQLPPYRDDDYQAAISNLEAVASALEDLPAGGGGLVDYDWIRAWQERAPDQKIEFTAYVQQWRKTFARIYEQCELASGATGGPDQTGIPAARMITGQHRMHPTIGELISEAYYGGELRNRTVRDSGEIEPTVLHPFTAPEGIADRAIVWLDVPWVEHGGEHEIGHTDGRPRYTNPAEVEAVRALLRGLSREDRDPLDLAVLSPYNRQVGLINASGLRQDVPAGLQLRSTHRRRAGDPDLRVAHTVDSFQGNQAALILVSLVRNNRRDPGDGLGFLADPARINVLLSRAERLLVLTGSFDFFRHQVQFVDLDDTSEPLWHWRKVISMLEDWFADGRAIKLPANSL